MRNILAALFVMIACAVAQRPVLQDNVKIRLQLDVLGVTNLGSGGNTNIETVTGGVSALNVFGNGQFNIGTTGDVVFSDFAHFYVNNKIELLAGGLYLGNSAAPVPIRMYEDIANGSNYTGWIARAALAGNTIYLMPIADGPAGAVLSTDGALGTSWVALLAANQHSFLIKTANYSLVATDDTIYASAASGNITITLPTPAAAVSGSVTRCYRVKRTDATANTVSVVVSGGANMDTYASMSLAPYQSLDFQSNGTQYYLH